MKKSTRALIGLVLIDALLVGGTAWLAWQVGAGAMKTSVPPQQAIETIVTIGGAAIGIVSTVLAIAFVAHLRRGN